MWKVFNFYAITSLILWVLAIVSSLFFTRRKLLAELLTLAGVISLLVFVVLLWNSLERPPLRTLGETRLWYSLFLAICGYVIFKRWKLSLILTYSLGMSVLFLLINYLKPEIHSKTLMPALQSIWFVPHVIVYMISYALLGLSALFGLLGIYKVYKKQDNTDWLNKADNIVYLGFGFLSLGLIFGALWAKEAWGHYWTWDPKETWAFITWAVYLIYIHYRIYKPTNHKQVYYILLFSFIILLVCWFGINYLPAAQNSVHIYSN